MEFLEAGFQALENIYSLFNTGLVYIDFLKTSCERMIFFKDSAIFLVSCGTNTLQITACQHRFHKVGGIHNTTGCSACTNNGVDLVNKQDSPFFFPDLPQYGLKPFFEIPAILGARDERTQVE